MAAKIPEPPEVVTPGDMGDLLASFNRAMKAGNASPNTILAYGGAVRQFAQWLMAHDYPTDVAAIQPAHIEEWIGSILETSKPTTAHNRWRGLQRFMNWYAEKDDDFVSPMRKLHPPRLPKLMLRVFSLEQLRLILGTCTSSSFEDRRDNALIRLLFDTGARRHEIAALRYSPTDTNDRDVDLRKRTIRVVGKGDKENVIPFGDKTVEAVSDYITLARKKHAHSDLPWLWLGARGQLTDSGIAQVLRHRGQRVGIPNLHAHDFRHTATHHELRSGLSESDVMSKRGWDSPAMLRRYAASTANERMIEASQKLGLGDKL